MKRRLIAYAVVIALTVGGTLAYLTREGAPPFGQNGPRGGGQRPNVPDKPWEASAEHDAQANAEFSVNSDRAGNTPLAGKSAAGGWPQFNGARRDNRSPETNLLAEWPEDGPPLAWTARGAGAGYSSVTVVDGVLFTMGNKGDTEAILALDVGTGEKLWSTPIAWASRLSSGDGPRGTPAVGGDAVFGLGGNGDLACLDRATGKIRWQTNILKEFRGQLPTW